MNPASPRQLFALLIGIDTYLPNPWCAPLYGALADVLAMEAFLQQHVSSRLDLPPENIVKLLSPQHEAVESCANCALPTYDSMVQAIQRLGRAATQNRGELLIHFSGHGCQTPTLLPGLKGASGKDEGLVPHDIGEPGARVLRDVELSFLLGRIAANGVTVTLIVDACHAGGIFRHQPTADSRVRRRAAQVDLPAAPSDRFTIDELATSWLRAHRRTYADASLRSNIYRGQASTLIPARPGITVLAACRERESAYEFPFDGEPRGALTHGLLAALTSGQSMPGWQRLQRQILHHIRAVGLHQTPVFEGEGCALLGMSRQGAPGTRGALRVLRVDPRRGRVLIDAGEALGLAPNARLRVCRSAADSGTEKGAGDGAELEVEECDASTAWARSSDGDLARIEPGDRAVLIAHGRRRLRVSIHAPPAVPQPTAARYRNAPAVLRSGRPRGWQPGDASRWRAAFEAELATADGFLELVNPLANDPQPHRPARFTFASNSSNAANSEQWRILSPDGLPVPHLPAIAISEDDAPRRLRQQLVHLARFETVRELHNADLTSPLHGTVELVLGRLPDETESSSPLEPVDCQGARPRFTEGATVCLTVANRSPRPLQLYVLALRADGSIQRIHPTGNLETLSPGQELRLGHRLPRRPPFASATPVEHIFKAIATVKPTNVRWLELPPWGAESTFDRTYRSVPSEPLDSYFSSVLGAPTAYRSGTGPAVSHQWTSAQACLEIVTGGTEKLNRL